MPRQPRDLQSGYCYHITVRCNNRAFDLNRPQCRELLLYALQRAKHEFGFKFYAVCLMSNHVHYLLEPKEAADLPRIMHWLNWYTAMCLNQMLGRKGHFWEQRYHSRGFAVTDQQQALNTLRYIHGNPKAAGIRQGFDYAYSNYRVYDQLSDDGLTQWHPAFLATGSSLDECARRYRWFCRNYQPRAKSSRHSTGKRECPWGRIQLAELTRLPRRGVQVSRQANLFELDEMDGPALSEVEGYQVQNQKSGQQSSLLPTIRAVTHQFWQANCTTWP